MGKVIKSLLGLVIAAVTIWYLFGGGLEKEAAKSMDVLYNQVAADAVKQYEIVARNGSVVDKCVHAGLVSASFVQAKDEVNYAHWKEVERADCARAGLPQ